MICPKCKLVVAFDMAEKVDKKCLKCGMELQPDVVELVSDPRLGVVKEVRPGQIEIARHLNDAMQNGGCVMAEGGCGVGKTFPYSIAAVLSPYRVVISTGKKSLQDQLAKKDLPHLQAVLGVPFTFESIKGKSNYLCKHELRRANRLFEKEGKSALRKHALEWLDGSHPGDLNEFPGSTAYPMNMVTAEDCSGCRRTCGYKEMKERARDAKIVVVNHSLLGFDMRLGSGRLFGLYEVLVVDEAHTSPEFFRSAFSDTLTPTWMKRVLGKLDREDIEYNLDPDYACARWEAIFKNIPNPDDTHLLPPGFMGDAKDDGVSILNELEKELDTYAKGTWGDYAEGCKSEKDGPTTADMLETINHEMWSSTADRMAKRSKRGVEGGADDDPEMDGVMVVQRVVDGINKNRDFLHATEAEDNDENYVFAREELRDGRPKIVQMPVNLAPLTGPVLSRPHMTTMTSATLNADSLRVELGLRPTSSISVASPFPYDRSLVYIPKHISRPGTEGWHMEIAEEVDALTRLSRGAAMVLFSSIADLSQVHDLLVDEWGLDERYPLFAQRKGVRPAEVFEHFMDEDNAILLGSKSFFEGVDVQGTKLRLVIIPKIPFPNPRDPLIQAKEKALGQRFWKDYYFPRMRADIEQAAGRLIRTRTDKGVVAILDPRIWTAGNKSLNPKDVGKTRLWRGYGQQIIKALPFPQYTHRVHYVKMLFDSMGLDT
jgi:ATP-dependent DNA helicase DinG